MVLAAAVLAVACAREEPVVGDKTLNYWASEARKYSIMPWWSSRNNERRAVAFRRLQELGEPAVPTLLDLLKSDNPPVSGDASSALCGLGLRARAALPELLRMLDEPGGPRQGDAADLLGCLGEAAASAVPSLERALLGPNAHLRRSAARSLGLIGPAGREALMRAATREGDAELREVAERALGFDPDAEGGWRERALADPEAAVRVRAVESVRLDKGPHREAAFQALIRGMNDESEQVRQAAHSAYARACQHQTIGDAEVAQVLTSGDLESRQDAAWRLGMRSQGQGADAGVLEAFGGALADPDPEVRVNAARSLWRLDRGSKQRVVETLREALAGASPKLQARASRVLWQANAQPEEVTGPLAEALRSSDRQAWIEALETVAEMGKAAEPVRAEVEALRQEQDPLLVRRVKNALKALGPA